MAFARWLLDKLCNWYHLTHFLFELIWMRNCRFYDWHQSWFVVISIHLLFIQIKYTNHMIINCLVDLLSSHLRMSYFFSFVYFLVVFLHKMIFPHDINHIWGHNATESHKSYSEKKRTKSTIEKSEDIRLRREEATGKYKSCISIIIAFLQHRTRITASLLFFHWCGCRTLGVCVFACDIPIFHMQQLSRKYFANFLHYSAA